MVPHKALISILASLLALTAVAGCITEPEPKGATDDQDDAGDDQGPGNTNDTADNDTAPAAGSPPNATLEVDLANSTAPAGATFTLGGSDADGDALTWTLDWDGDGTVDTNGTSLPATVNVTIDEPGDYTALLVVTDKDGSGNATVSFTIETPPVVDEMCHRPDATSLAGSYWLDHRGGTSIWLYEESNGVEGLQVGHPEDETDEFLSCANPDTLIF